MASFPEHSSDTSLEKREALIAQFNAPERLKAGGPHDEIYDVGPRDAEIPVFYAQGFVSNPKTHRENILALAKCNRRVLAISTYHGIDAKPDGIHPEILLRKAMAIIEALEQKQIKKTDAVGYSEGTLNVLLSAYLHPERFRNLVLVEPVGVIGKDTFFKQWMRHLADGLAGLAPVEKLKEYPRTSQVNIRESDKLKLKHYFKLQSWKHVINTAKALANTDATKFLADVRQKGVKVSIIHSADSRLVPSKRIQDTLPKDSVDGFYELPGPHGAYNLYPEAYTQAIEHALTRMTSEDKPKRHE